MPFAGDNVEVAIELSCLRAGLRPAGCTDQEGDDAALNCAENGVIAPLVGIIGTSQALEAIKLIADVGDTLVGRVLYFDAKYMEWRNLKLTQREVCSCCNPATGTVQE